MLKIGEFIYPWGSGHYSRMMRLNDELANFITQDFEVHYSSKDHVYQKLLKRFPTQKDKIHEILMPTPIDGNFGPSITLSLMNLLVSVSNQPPLIKQIASYLKKEGKLFNKEKFDLVINDGDMGANIIADRRDIPSMFVTNQFKPKLYKSRMYFYPALVFIAKQISKATKIIVADSPPPYTLCEYNLNFTDSVKKKVEYVGHFTPKKRDVIKKTRLGELIKNDVFGYWMRTGNKSTNDATGKRYDEIFQEEYMKKEKRIISHARNDPSLNTVRDKDGRSYTVDEALEKKIDWVQIDIGFLSEDEKDIVLEKCHYAVINGSHTVMGEILGGCARPIIGMPIYDEHTNQIQWAQEKRLGILADNTKQAIGAIDTIKENYSEFDGALAEFSKNFMGNGAQNAAKIASELIDKT